MQFSYCIFQWCCYGCFLVTVWVFFNLLLLFFIIDVSLKWLPLLRDCIKTSAAALSSLISLWSGCLYWGITSRCLLLLCHHWCLFEVAASTEGLHQDVCCCFIIIDVSLKWLPLLRDYIKMSAAAALSSLTSLWSSCYKSPFLSTCWDKSGFLYAHRLAWFISEIDLLESHVMIADIFSLIFPRSARSSQLGLQNT